MRELYEALELVLDIKGWLEWLVHVVRLDQKWWLLE
jgi:hypothetical protein